MGWISQITGPDVFQERMGPTVAGSDGKVASACARGVEKAVCAVVGVVSGSVCREEGFGVELLVSFMCICHLG